MPTRLLTALLLALFLGGTGFSAPLYAQSNPSASASDTSWAGSWEGMLRVPGAELRVVFHLDRTDGSLTGTMDSPDQGASDIPLEATSVSSDSLALAVPSIAGRYEGVRTAPDTLRGNWMQGGIDPDLVLVRTDAPSQVSRPQQPEAPFPYATEDVRFASGADPGPTLAGTFSYPEASDSVPAVVLVSGSGPQTRTGEAMGHETLTVLADYLTRQGIAVLRYDERGQGESGGILQGATTPMLSDDVRGALSYLEARSEVDARRIGIVGHSEGGLIAGYLAARHPEQVDFLVMLGSPGVPGDAVLRDQLAASAERAGAQGARVDAQLQAQQRAFDIVTQDADSAAVADELRTFITETSGISQGARIDREIRSLTDPWFRFFVRYDPTTDLQQLTQPVLALLGARDQQVRPGLNAEPLEAALRTAPTDAYDVVVLSKINHLFQTADTGAPAEYARIEQTMAPEVLDRIAAWILDRSGDK